MILYLEKFRLPSREAEYSFFAGQPLTCYNTYYPFEVFTEREVPELIFEPITFFYGGNGSGKTTMLNVIAEKIGAVRDTPFNHSTFFGDYVDSCKETWAYGYSHQDSMVITSDDVFDYIFNIRAMNEGIDVKRVRMLDEYSKLRYSNFKMRSLADYEELKRVNSARFNTKSEFVRKEAGGNIRELSNGESALMYFSEKIQNNRIYLLDEPENSLSAEYQKELLKFITDSARFFNCQFIIATHSPFLLSAEGALIYDLDSDPVEAKKWTELGNVRSYYNFFKEHENEFH
jgi:Predicted ATPase